MFFPQGDSKNAARAGMQTCIGRRCFFPNIRQRFFHEKRPFLPPLRENRKGHFRLSPCGGVG
jgi:hypothetical protein